MDGELRGILDAMFAKQTDADAEKKECKKKLRRDFVQSFVGAVHRAIRERAGTTVAFGETLRFPLWYSLPDALREDMPWKCHVVCALDTLVGCDASLRGFEIRVEDTGYSDEQVYVSIRRASQ